MRVVLPIVGAAAALAVAVAAVVVGHAFQLFDRSGAWPLTAVGAIALAGFAVAVTLLFRVRGRAALVLVVVGAAVLGGAALAGPPHLSTDSARYAWDGIVQDAGVSPYEHVPASSALAGLRPGWLYPAPVDGRCAGQRIMSTREEPGGALLCTALNRPRVPTIYPPVSEAYFAAVRALVPTTAAYAPLQVGGLLLVGAVGALLALLLRRGGRDPRWSALWLWCPFVLDQAVTDSHVDVLGVLFAVAATGVLAVPVLRRRRAVVGGVLLGLGVATKFIPGLVAPPLLRRRPVAVVLAAAGAVAAVYAPYLLASGPKVIGYLPGYFSEEGYESGSRSALLSLVLPGSWSTVGAAVLVAVVAAFAVWRADPERPWGVQAAVVGATLLIVTPAYPWYALLLVPFAAMAGRPEWLVVTVAMTVRQLHPGLATSRAAFGAAVIVLLVALAVRHRAEIPAVVSRLRLPFGARAPLPERTSR
ncbi:hypothetical protein GCM10009840_03210 [Pseudolysinimonas kribbensis]|uniref:DUF2029 domain-containing protein n=1 Tax=Pseudolysinimonas kribbensis TaxID=433641 RepID=A0ABQ6K759_9MICO|nr:glycosyltransferase 87 family protein [Pseudolysinimonas kribbensis]GMA94622.1 hypothetical protein GCM10025881_14460 [Pseudolysinimonas kribbensis]